MGYGHPMDLRRHIIEAVQAGASAREAARHFAVCPPVPSNSSSAGAKSSHR